MYYCKKYSGFVTQKKAFNRCLCQGCPHLRRSRKPLKRQRARDKAGKDKSVWKG